MELKFKYVSSLEKIRNKAQLESAEQLQLQSVFAGENYSFQLCMTSDAKAYFDIKLDSPIKEYLNLYFVKYSACDCPNPHDDDVIATEPTLIPDILLPTDKQKNKLTLNEFQVTTIWIEACIPQDMRPGKYPIKLEFVCANDNSRHETQIEIEISPCILPKQSTTFTQWFYADCIADVHGVPVYSEAHWMLIEKYMKLAHKLGINMILTPIITPPLDTEVGIKRTCVQLVRIEKRDKYYFDFSLLDKWIDLSLKCGIKYFEMSHLFSQWGLHKTPNIVVKENGTEAYKFSSDVDAKDEEYKVFLKQFLAELAAHLKNRNLYEKCYFHISDEPYTPFLENYRYGKEIVSSIIDEERMIDALSHVDFYDEGLVKNPVPAINAIKPFLERDIKNRWCYYCCSQWEKVSNRFLNMPSYRNRIIGLQMYKFDIAGFLHWGYNFYNSAISRYHVNPYVSSGADLGLPSGDTFTVYPWEDDVIPSLRGLVFKEGLQDIELCRELEKYIGRDAVVKMIDDEAGMNVTFEEYPRCADYILNVTNKMKKMIEIYGGK